jgi:16S rRNA (cytosine1402-N4)-methyltransferase
MRSPSTGTKEDFSSALFLAGQFGNTPEDTSRVGGLRMGQDFAHDPVLLDEVVALFATVPPGLIVDATLGGGGHAAALLDAHPHLRLLGLDADGEALEAAATRLARFGERASVRHAHFGDLEHVVAEVGVADHLSGVLFDLGLSSRQLDVPGRGFSYRREGPLDMRMDQGSSGPSARELVNEASEGQLTELFAANGEGRLARRLARAVVAARPLTTTTQLADVVSEAVPAAARRKGHPARRVFQALRIEVNKEIDQLAAALPVALANLAVGGRCVVIAYHSGEDRLVKKTMADAVTGGCTCPPGLPCGCGAVVEHRLVFRGSH